MSLSCCHLISALDSLEIGKAAGTEITLSPALCSSYPLSPASVNSLGWHQREGVDSPAAQDPWQIPARRWVPQPGGPRRDVQGHHRDHPGYPALPKGFPSPATTAPNRGHPTERGSDLAQLSPGRSHLHPSGVRNSFWAELTTEEIPWGVFFLLVHAGALQPLYIHEPAPV